MSHFGSLMQDFDEDFFGNQINAVNTQIRSMEHLMNSLRSDPFNALRNFNSGIYQDNRSENPRERNTDVFDAFLSMPNMNSLLSTNVGNNGTSFSSRAVMAMSSGPDGKPQFYQATTSTAAGPGGIRETSRSLHDSIKGVKKMAIGHHIGERAHIIEKEQDLHSGQLEERQEFINLLENQADDFDQEFITKARGAMRGIYDGKNNSNNASATLLPPRTASTKSRASSHLGKIKSNTGQRGNVRSSQQKSSLSSSLHISPALSVEENPSHPMSTQEISKKKSKRQNQK